MRTLTSNTRKTSKTDKTPTAAELSRQALAEAQAQLAARQEQHTHAVAAAEELVDRLAAGDDTPTAVDLGNARDEAERAGLLVQAAETKVKHAERALINDDTALAELMVDVLAEVFDGRVPVTVAGMVRDAQPDPDGGPRVVIVQEKPTGKSGGIMTGVVDVIFYRPRLFAPLDARAIEHHCRAQGFAVQPHQLSQMRQNEMHRDALRVRVERAALPVPELSQSPTDAAVHEFGRDVSGDLMQAVTVAQQAVAYMNEPATGQAFSELVSSRLVSSLPGEDGAVHVTVEAAWKVKPGGKLPDHYANERIRQVIAQQVGYVAEGVGRVVETKAVSIDMPDMARAGRGKPWKVTARSVLVHRLI